MDILVNFIQSFNLSDILSNNLLYGFAISYFLGILTAFTPCVWPMYPITASIIVKSTGESKNSVFKNFIATFVYILGMALMFAFIGFLSGVFGAQVQSLIRSPYVTIGIGLIFVVLSLSLFGLYEIQLPYFIRKRFGQGGVLNKKKGYFGLFSLGIVSGVVASPCTLAPLAAIILFITQTGNIVLGFFILAIFGFGIGTPLLIVGTFSGSVNKLPKSGKWMYIFQYLMGIALVIVGLYFIVPSINDIVHNKKADTTEKNVVCDPKTGICHLRENNGPSDGSSKTSDYWAEIKSNENIDAFYKKNSPFMLKFTAKWCSYCKQMEKETLFKKDFIDLTDGIHLIYFNGTDPDDIGKKVLQRYKVPGYPTFVLYNGQRDTTFYGYHSKSEVEKIVKTFYGEFFKKKQFILE